MNRVVASAGTIRAASSTIRSASAAVEWTSSRSSTGVDVVPTIETVPPGIMMSALPGRRRRLTTRLARRVCVTSSVPFEYVISIGAPASPATSRAQAPAALTTCAASIRTLSPLAKGRTRTATMRRPSRSNPTTRVRRISRAPRRCASAMLSSESRNGSIDASGTANTAIARSESAGSCARASATSTARAVMPERSQYDGKSAM